MGLRKATVIHRILWSPKLDLRTFRELFMWTFPIFPRSQEAYSCMLKKTQAIASAEYNLVEGVRTGASCPIQGKKIEARTPQSVEELEALVTQGPPNWKQRALDESSWALTVRAGELTAFLGGSEAVGREVDLSANSLRNTSNRAEVCSRLGNATISLWNYFRSRRKFHAKKGRGCARRT